MVQYTRSGTKAATQRQQISAKKARHAHALHSQLVPPLPPLRSTKANGIRLRLEEGVGVVDEEGLLLWQLMMEHTVMRARTRSPLQPEPLLQVLGVERHPQ